MDTPPDKPEALPPFAIATRTPDASVTCRRAFMQLSIKYHPHIAWSCVPMGGGGHFSMLESAGELAPGLVVQELSNAMALHHGERGDSWWPLGEWATAQWPDDEDEGEEWMAETLNH